MSEGWVGFDLDGTLVVYDEWRGAMHIGEPIPSMVNLVKKYLEKGTEVRIVTARVSGLDLAPIGSPEYKEAGACAEAISAWSLRTFGRFLQITCSKDFNMLLLYDDRAIQVETNTGRIIQDGNNALSYSNGGSTYYEG